MNDFDFVNQANAEYIDRVYEQYRKDPRAVEEKWRVFFAGFDLGHARDKEAPKARAVGRRRSADATDIGVYDLVHSYRELGHFVANLDPLGHDRPNHPLLDLNNFGMTVADLDRTVPAGGFQGCAEGTVRELIKNLRTTYCGTIGVEFTGIADKSQREWLISRMEPILNKPAFTPAEQKSLLFQLIAAEEFEQYLHRAYVGTKRFGLEGADALIPLINTIVEEGAVHGADAVIMGMAHRGRLNVLAHVINKPYEVLLSEFEGTNARPANFTGDGDVKYHLGFANSRPVAGGKTVKVSLLPNPSHLELIDPIQQGIIRCKQEISGDKDRTRMVPLVMHGDAAFTGQGIVFETLGLSELPGYRTGGTIHVIVNNQIGFTTSPRQGRFTPYPTDMAKAIQAPIFHVNGDDPEAVVWAAKLAIGFRQQFKCDVMIDLWCYRRHGHNETDEPSFTQPVMYRQIEGHKTTREIYQERLIADGRIPEAEVAEMKKIVVGRLDSARALAKEVKPRMKVPMFSGVWKGYGRASNDWSAKTGVSKEQLKKIAEVGTAAPSDFTVHPKLVKMLQGRRDAVNKGVGIDWGCGEMLALGSLLAEGTRVRFAGQDVERGTFSHRHAVLHDYTDGRVFIPLKQLADPAGNLTIMNTMLSEEAVLGFEWGYSSADPRNLVIWEAQFGDFVNGAQAIIDQIIVAAESKWHYMNGLVMLLPHGFEGAGPEHSNAYLERFLSLCAEENIQVAMPSTPANYFHLLRRQIHRKFRKPLILMMPKFLLRYEPSASQIEEFIEGSVQLVIDDPSAPDPAGVKRLLFCSGKVYYTLLAARDKEKLKDVALVRVEQFYPFPRKEISALLSRYRNATDIGWVQEEPKNRGGWTFMEPRVRELLPAGQMLSYFGRDEAASPATGSIKMHNAEEQEFVGHALDLAAKKPQPPKAEATVPAAGAAMVASAEVKSASAVSK